ncbi:MAG: hypothetical protein ABIQ72_09335 [Usitatibacter sp.]
MRSPLIVFIFSALIAQAHAAPMKPGELYCMHSPEDASFYVFKIVAVEGGEIFARQHNPVSACPRSLDEHYLSESIQVLPLLKEVVANSNPQLVGYRVVTAAELDDVVELKKSLKGLEDIARSGKLKWR